MQIYVCLETIINNSNIITKIKKYYEAGHNITIACTRDFRKKNSRKSIERMLIPLGNNYHTLSFLKPRYDKIIDNKSMNINQSVDSSSSSSLSVGS